MPSIPRSNYNIDPPLQVVEERRGWQVVRCMQEHCQTPVGYVPSWMDIPGICCRFCIQDEHELQSFMGYEQQFDAHDCYVCNAIDRRMQMSNNVSTTLRALKVAFHDSDWQFLGYDNTVRCLHDTCFDKENH